MIKKLHCYKLNNKYLLSYFKYDNLNIVSEKEIRDSDEIIYFLNKLDPIKSRKSFSISHPSLLNIKEEDIKLLQINSMDSSDNIPNWLLEKINNRKLMSVNTNHPLWMDLLGRPSKTKWRVNLIALGDVGSNLLIGLRLLGGESIREIGIYDRDINRLKRWEHEANQIRRPFDELSFPKVVPVKKDNLFDCDMFIFCASKGIPAIGSKIEDVRMAQFESNSQIISQYGKMARNKNFKGIFAVVSDPVDLLCKVAYLESNKNEEEEFDFKGLSSDQIIGYGLGVMNARACFYAEQSPDMYHYIEEGRVFGPHGEGLIVANSIENYNEDISKYLTEKTINANKEVRAFGYKPFIAPSLSSGSLSIIATIKGDWFYGSTYMKDVYMGSKCRLLSSGIEVEQLNLPEDLFKDIKKTYKNLAMII